MNNVLFVYANVEGVPPDQHLEYIQHFEKSYLTPWISDENKFLADTSVVVLPSIGDKNPQLVTIPWQYR